jgi:hypothetical protein
MIFKHIKLKPTKKKNINFDLQKLNNGIEIPEKSLKLIREYTNSKKLSDAHDKDLMLLFEDSIIFGFDFLHDEKKILIPEINPTTIFYSNAVMSHKKLIFFRNQLFENSPTTRDFSKPINPNIFGEFFQLASNCLINMQSALESFSNRQIPESYEFNDVDGNVFKPSIFHKLDSALPKVHNKRFKSSFKKDNIMIRNLIELRNEIVHLRPIEKDTNTQYKITYRKLLKFNFTKAIKSVRNLINFYEPNLIEECECGRVLYYDICE